MDFLDPKKRKAHRTRLLVGYALIAIALLLVARFLMLAASGYGYDRKTRSIVQNGLVFVGSHPVASDIYVNGASRGNTDARFALEEGSYSFELRQNGYRTWKHDLALEGGSVERLVYPFLFPTQLQSTDSLLMAEQPDMVTQSPDRHWLLVHRASVPASFEIIDANDKNNPNTTAALPADILGSHEGATKMSAVEWSTNNRHVLVKYEYAGGYDFLIIDRESPNQSINLNQIFGRQFAQVRLYDQRVAQIYALDAPGGNVLLGTIASKSLTTELNRVVSFFPYGKDTLLYATTAGASAGKANVSIRQGVANFPVRSLPLDSSYLLNMASFDGDMYVVVGAPLEAKAYLYQNPVTQLKKSGVLLPTAKTLLKTDRAGEFVSFSTNARFVALQAGSTFAVYDFETNRLFRYSLGGTAPLGQKAAWMDGHRLSFVLENKLRIFDFDGTNQQTLLPAFPAYQPFFDRDYKALYSLSPSQLVKDRPALVRTSLLVNK